MQITRAIPRRSLASNNYFHALVSRIAATVWGEFDEIKSDLVVEYGTPCLDKAGQVVMGCAGYVVIGDTLINPCTAYDKKGLLPAGDPERIWFTPLFSDGIWYGRRLAAQMDLLISGNSRKSPENVNSFTEKPEKVADSPAKDTKKPCSFTEPAKAAARVSTPVSTKKVETWKPAELNETKNGQLTFF